MKSPLALLFFCAGLTVDTNTARADDPDGFEFGREKAHQTVSRRARDVEETDIIFRDLVEDDFLLFPLSMSMSLDNDDDGSPSISNFTTRNTLVPTNDTFLGTNDTFTNETLVTLPSNDDTVDVDRSDESVQAAADGTPPSGSLPATAAVVTIAGVMAMLTAVLSLC